MEGDLRAQVDGARRDMRHPDDIPAHAGFALPREEYFGRARQFSAPSRPPDARQAPRGLDGRPATAGLREEGVTAAPHHWQHPPPSASSQPPRTTVAHKSSHPNLRGHRPAAGRLRQITHPEITSRTVPSPTGSYTHQPAPPSPQYTIGAPLAHSPTSPSRPTHHDEIPNSLRIYTSRSPTFAPGKRPRGMTTSVAKNDSGHLAAGVPLRPSASIPDLKSGHAPHTGLRARYPPVREYEPYRGPGLHVNTQAAVALDQSPTGLHHDDGAVRASLKSAVTAYSSSTERSSVLTKDTSVSESATLNPSYQDQFDGGMSVDDAIGMYERGFDDDDDDGFSDKGSDHLAEVEASARESIDRHEVDVTEPETTVLKKDEIRDLQDGPVVAPRDDRPVEPPDTSKPHPALPSFSPQAPPLIVYERDRYGFRIVSQHVTLPQYKKWDASYSEYLERRRKKWVALFKEHNLPTNPPERFPERTAKVKRFVRKGVPPEWRGAAWFWYGGGHVELRRHPGVYKRLVDEAEQGQINKNDRELIERDLHRTFPDNIKFKPNPSASYDAVGNAGGGYQGGAARCEVETPNIEALRRVLQAFSIYNPKIGYCQSLNFLVGLLLLFMDEEKAFWMVNIITRVYLPGTHEINLEGANVDLAVLMTSLRESMPAIWAKLAGDLDGFSDGLAANNGGNGGGDGGGALTGTRLPPVFLCATAWFMSCFIGTLPIETVLRVWDSFFYEGSKTLFRIALAIFKVGEHEIRAVNDPMEIFQVVQTIPRRLLDANALMEACYRRRNGFGHLSQETIDDRRRRWRVVYAREHAATAAAAAAAAAATAANGARGSGSGNGVGDGGPSSIASSSPSTISVATTAITSPTAATTPEAGSSAPPSSSSAQTQAHPDINGHGQHQGQGLGLGKAFGIKRAETGLGSGRKRLFF